MPPLPDPSVPLVEPAPPISATVPESVPMTDVVTPPNTTVVSDGHDDHSNAALWAMSGDHRNSLQVSNEGRFTALADLSHQKALADLEARSSDRIAQVLTYIKEEGDKTRQCLMQQEIDRLRADNTRLSVTVRA
jgi:hypothetical protein